MVVNLGYLQRSISWKDLLKSLWSKSVGSFVSPFFFSPLNSKSAYKNCLPITSPRPHKSENFEH